MEEEEVFTYANTNLTRFRNVSGSGRSHICNIRSSISLLDLGIGNVPNEGDEISSSHTKEREEVKWLTVAYLRACSLPLSDWRQKLHIVIQIYCLMWIMDDIRIIIQLFCYSFADDHILVAFAKIQVKPQSRIRFDDVHNLSFSS